MPDKQSSLFRKLRHFRLSRRSRVTALSAMAVFSLLVASAVAQAQSNAQKTLDRFKSMVGTWQGKSPSGGTSEVTYRLAAGGTAVMADMHIADEDMVSMYYVDGDQLLMTHFCPSSRA
jgi:hypothetical protein